MLGRGLATTGEVDKDFEEESGVLTESTNIAPAVQKGHGRGGKASRERRLETYRQSKAAAAATVPAAPAAAYSERLAAKWERLAQGLSRQHRATLRDGAEAAWVRTRAARMKIRAVFRLAWRSRSLDITGIESRWAGEGQFVTGQKVAPLSRRDVWGLSRAVHFMQVCWNRDSDIRFDPEHRFFYRHTLDWLRRPTEDGQPSHVHTHRAIDAEGSEEVPAQGTRSAFPCRRCSEQAYDGRMAVSPCLVSLCTLPG